jgi:F-type H+-transporting ATPase subunit a
VEIHPSLLTYLIAHLMGIEDMHHFAYKDHIIAAGLTFVLITLFALVVRSRMSLLPGKGQQMMELLVGGLIGLLETNIGKEGRRFLPIVGTFSLFILISNLLGMIPGCSSATGNFNTTVACALIVFVYYHFQGIREHGFHYIHQFTGPVWWLIPLMLPIEIISHMARPFSLSMRLFINIAGEHLVVGIIAGLVPLLVPVPIMALGLLAACLQTFIFVMLTTLYIAGARSHDH